MNPRTILPGEKVPDEKEAHREKLLDDALMGTFPASDPVSISTFDVPLGMSLIKPANESHCAHG